VDSPRAILFDLDGVLVDSYWVWFHLINDTARRLGYPAVSQERYYESWGQSTTADRDSFFPRHTVEEVERLYEGHYFSRPLRTLGGGLSPRAAIERIATRSAGGGAGLISDKLRALASSPSFEGVLDLLDVSRDAGDLLDDDVSTFARVYLQNAERAVIVFVHAVTGPATLRPLRPYLDPEDRIRGVLHAWQTAAGLYAAYGKPFDPAVEPECDAPDAEELAARAAENGDDHVIKLTEVCLREWRRSDDEALLAAAADVLETL
jgi:hypothetical protein